VRLFPESHFDNFSNFAVSIQGTLLAAVRNEAACRALAEDLSALSTLRESIGGSFGIFASDQIAS
jgi:hypothetical protein